MMRSKPSSSMQKTYDECYLICSTAVYFEGQNNEAEALRSWRSALDTLYHHKAYRVPANYSPKSETEKALQDSLRQLENQCKERVDLLEALRESREEAKREDDKRRSSEAPPKGKLEKGRTSTNSVADGPSGWIGEGTIPAADYPDLSRPGPALPPRPSFFSRFSSDPKAKLSKSDPPTPSEHISNTLPSPPTLPVPTPVSPNPSTRTASPHRKTMLTTLRSGEPKKSSKPTKEKNGRRGFGPAASRAAGMAWTSVSRPPDSDSSTVQGVPGGWEAGLSAQNLSSRHSVPNSMESRRSLDTRRVSNDDARQQNVLGGERASSRTARDSQSVGAAAMAARTSLDSAPLIDLPDPSPPLSRSSDPFSSSAKKRGQPKTTIYPSSRNEYLDARPNTKDKNFRSASNMSLTSDRQRSNTEASDSSNPRGVKSATTSRPQIQKFNTYGSSGSGDDELSQGMGNLNTGVDKRRPVSRGNQAKRTGKSRPTPPSSEHGLSESSLSEDEDSEDIGFEKIMKNLPKGVDANSARQILNDIVVRGDEVHWDDVAGLDAAKKALKEAVVYPFLRPDLFMGLREPARGMLLFGPPGTGKTMLARAVATESKSTFFSVSASSLTSKWHGESEKLVRALFALAKALAPSIIFVDEIDSLLSSRSTGNEGEASRRSKTEFLIQWSDLQRAAAGREQSDKEKKEGDASRVLVLAATNMPWDIDEAARRRFVRRQYIPLPEDHVRGLQLRTLLSHQKQELSDDDIEVLVQVTEGFSGSDITALAKDAAMGPLRNLGEALLHTPMDQIRPIRFGDFEASLISIRPSVSRDGLKEYEDWAKEFGERGG
ncbi:hypothetical protein FQN54_004691 [Arachnomyces sp. PD_36]|nr:hypothetical protein FQN54_004691 [Arachnomyces sp. PD_36]